jgi:alkaline ceramidase TOD1/glycosyltransferase MUCI70-like protein
VERVAIVTALYGHYDSVKPAPRGAPAWLFTDSEVTQSKAWDMGWECVIVPHGICSLKGDPRIVAPMLAHKWWKTHTFKAAPESDIVIWVDASMEVTVEGYVDRCLEALAGDELSLMRHPERTCIYPEADYSATLTHRYDGPSILAQAAYYRDFHPPAWGLFATGNIVFRHTENVVLLGQQWWHECITRSHQDQLSLPVLVKLMADAGKLSYNTNIPWHEWWTLHGHG